MGRKLKIGFNFKWIFLVVDWKIFEKNERFIIVYFSGILINCGCF